MKRTLSQLLTVTLALTLFVSCQQQQTATNSAGTSANAANTSSADNTSSTTPSYIDLVGKWEGQAGGHPATLVITSHMGDTFSGTETVGDFQLKIAGVVDLKTRQITIRETDVIKGQGSYPLGVGTGVVAPNSRQISGEWKAKGSTSSFTFTK